MAYELDLSLLAQNLRDRKQEAVEDDARAEVNPYLLNTIFPMLLLDKAPKMSEIDFGRFELQDPGNLAYYCQEHDHRAYELLQLNKRLCESRALCAKARAFL